GFREINEKRSALRFIEQSGNIPEKCTVCKYVSICRGGCKRYCEPLTPETRSLNLLCQGYEQFFEHCLPRLRQLAGLLRTS
ncbi:MAG: anaerobic sulfatase maturase, partial [Oscillospiraceae bacterium]